MGYRYRFRRDIIAIYGYKCKRHLEFLDAMEGFHHNNHHNNNNNNNVLC